MKNNILKFILKPVNKKKVGAVRDSFLGELDLSDNLAELLSSIYNKYNLKQKFIITVYILPAGSLSREERFKTITLRTLLKWYKEDTGKNFDKKLFKKEKKQEAKDRLTDAISLRKRYVENPSSKQIS